MLLIINFDLKLTEEQKIFAVDEAMNKVGTTRWKQIQSKYEKKLDDMGITDAQTVYMDFGGSINPIGAKTGSTYINYMMTSLGREQAHGTGVFDIRYHILRNPNWTLEEKQKLIMDFWTCDSTYDRCLEEWEWAIVNDDANLERCSESPLEPYFLYDYPYDLLLRFYDITDPLSGAIYVDNLDISKIPKRTYRSNIGIVLQEPIMLKGDIASNIRFGKEEISDEEVEDFDGDDEPCSACGNPAYPKCKISCSFFDD